MVVRTMTPFASRVSIRAGESVASALVAAGWKPPEVFVAKGRDGTTDIWGVIIRPMNFDPTKKYPVIEYIYAGPQGFFVPKAFSPVIRSPMAMASSASSTSRRRP